MIHFADRNPDTRKPPLLCNATDPTILPGLLDGILVNVATRGHECVASPLVVGAQDMIVGTILQLRGREIRSKILS